VRTEVDIVRGPLRGRRGWIAGSLKDRATRGITKAIVHCGLQVELLLIESLQEAEPDLFANKNAAGAIADGVG